MRLFRRRLALLVCVLLAVTLAPTGVAFADASPLAPGLAAMLSRASVAERIPVIVYLNERATIPALPVPPVLPGRSRQAHRRAVVEALHQTADRTQEPLLRLLAIAQSQGRVDGVRSLWVINAVALRAT